MELLHLDDLCLTKIFSYTNISTYQSLACTCQKLHTISKHPRSVGSKHMLKKTYLCFIQHIKDMVDRDNCDQSLERMLAFKKNMRYIFGSYVVFLFTSYSEKFRLSFPKDLFETVIQLCHFVPNNVFLQPMEFTLKVDNGKDIYVNIQDGLDSWGFDFCEVQTEGHNCNTGISKVFHCKMDQVEKDARKKRIQDVVDKLYEIEFDEENISLSYELPEEFTASTISEETLHGITAKVQQQINHKLHSLAKEPFFKCLQKCSQVLSLKIMVRTLFNLTRSIEPIFGVYEKFSYGELLGYEPLACSLLKRYDIYGSYAGHKHGTPPFPHVYGFKLCKEKLFVHFDAFESAPKFTLVTPGQDVRIESLHVCYHANSRDYVMYLQRNPQLLDETIKALERYVESAFNEEQLRSIPQITHTFVAKFFDILSGQNLVLSI